MPPTEIQIRLQQLQAEWAIALAGGLAADAAYLADLAGDRGYS
jgi:hypothetical protein